MTDTPRRILGDPDANVVYPITDSTGSDVDWSSPSVKARQGSAAAVTVSCTWVDAAGPTRKLRVPLSSLAAGTHLLTLTVPGDNDVRLGSVHLA